MSKAEEVSPEFVHTPPRACPGKVSFQGFQVLTTQDAEDADEILSISLATGIGGASGALSRLG